MEDEPGINEELELYKIITKGDYECGWVSDTEYFVWLSFSELSEFVENIKKIFGCYIFEEGGVEVRLLQDGVCMDLNNLLCDVDIDLERVFPREEFKH